VTYSLAKLAVDGLTVERGGRTVLSDLSFSCSAGQALIIRGANGSGKSTLLRALSTLLEIKSGAVHLDGLALEEAEERAEHIHYLGHLDGIKTPLTVEENLGIWRDYYGGDRGDQDLAPALRAFDLTPLRDLPAQYLSAGQKKRLALSKLLVVQRPLWCLDEPSVSLDVHNKSLLSNLINQHTAAGGIAVVTSHENLPLADALELRIDNRDRKAA